MEKELLFEIKEITMAINLKEFTPEGAKLDIMVAGKVTGKVTGQIMTTHNASMKPDDTGSADVRSMIFSNGESIMVMGNASGKMVDPAPTEKIEENLTFMTMSKQLAYLNTTKGWADATYNLAKANTSPRSTPSNNEVDTPCFQNNSEGIEGRKRIISKMQTAEEHHEELVKALYDQMNISWTRQSSRYSST